ncbi:MAG: type I-C CRISPR-associated protein Cas7/Csd2 [Methylococcales bacterium]
MSLENRYDFVYLFDVKDGNPNGDPDAGNLPRVDAETGQGLVTDVCLKRKIRNYIEITKSDESGFRIYVKEKAVLNNVHKEAYAAYELIPELKKLPKNEQDARKVTGWMCSNFYDIRTFGAVMSTEINCGQIRGPVQFTFSRSIDPIISQEHSITRMAVTNEKDLEKEKTMGRKSTVPYGLYTCHGFISAHLAQQTGFGKEDLALLFASLENMFEHDRSAARGEMTARGLYVFKHTGKLGNASAHSLFERINVRLKEAVSVSRAFDDYEIKVDDQNLPNGVELIRRIG